MKKLLCVLSVVAVVALGIVGALAVVPHAHGNDFKHAQHESCPVYQMGLAHCNAAFSAVISFVFFAFIVWRKTASAFCAEKSPFFFAFLRAPPVSI